MSDETRSGEYGETWLEVVAAIQYLGARHRPELTVWDALAEAVRWWIEGASSQNDMARGGRTLPWNDPDPMRTALQSLLGSVGPPGTMDGHGLPAALDGALCCWLVSMAMEYNDGQSFTRPNGTSP